MIPRIIKAVCRFDGLFKRVIFAVPPGKNCNEVKNIIEQFNNNNLSNNVQ
jgi:hypothetical protein